MTSKISDERLAELRALQQKRIKGRGGVPEVRDLASALAELAEYRAREAESGYQWSVMSSDGFVPWSFVNRKKAEEAASGGGTLVRRLIGPWEAVGDDDRLH